jgi:molybdate transport system substrate-binding protein
LAEIFSADTKVKVRINPGPSNGLANQIIAGAPADLFLSANVQWAEEVQKHDLAAASERLLTNKLALVVPEKSPASVHQPSDLLSDKVKKVALAGENVPAGMYADQALTKLDLFKTLTDAGKIVRGQDVRNTLSFVERGEAEAGIVYSTDLKAATGVVSVSEFDPSLHDEIVYVLVLLKHGEGRPGARQLYDFLQAEASNTTYEEFGFSRLPADEAE